MTGAPEFAALAERCADWQPDLAIVLGSGLGGLAERFEILDEIAYGAVDGLHSSRVPGHNGRFLLAGTGESRFVIAQGRVHLYEGFAACEVTASVRAIATLGAQTIVLTNAAGAINPEFAQLGWMGITDHLNLTGASPLTGNPSFFDMSEVYDRRLLAQIRESAAKHGIDYGEGVYAGVLGPQYETPAEIRMLGTLGADAVGMSTVLEAIEARARKMRVLGLSCLTNWASGMSPGELNHDEVVERGHTAVDDLENLVRGLLASAGT